MEIRKSAAQGSVSPPASKRGLPTLARFVKEKRREYRLTQEGLSQRAGVGLRFVRDLEQGKPTLRLDKVNQVLGLFGYEAGAVTAPRPTFPDEF